MIPVPNGAKVWLALGHTDMRRGMRSLALQVQQALNKDVHAGDLYVFRGKSGSLCKILWHDGIGMSLYATDWSAGASCGRLPKTGRSRSRARDGVPARRYRLAQPQETWRPTRVG
jgi:transposase